MDFHKRRCKPYDLFKRKSNRENSEAQGNKRKVSKKHYKKMGVEITPLTSVIESLYIPIGGIL